MVSAMSPRDEDVARHTRFGWWALAVFVVAGLVLEGLHAFKAASYLDGDHATRRLMWRLAHAHGSLFGLLNLAFAASLPRLDWSDRRRATASFCWRGATLLMPLGFFLGGLHFHGGDPGVGVLLVPVGGVMLLLAVSLTALATRSP
jgi:hypothetical protein